MTLRIALLLSFLAGCGSDPPRERAATSGGEMATNDDGITTTSAGATRAGGGATASGGADVTAVAATGSPGDYTFQVTIASPDTGCAAYADWWEVVAPDGTLVYRRILAHSHVDEQPFTRSGGPVDVDPSDEVIVRAHFNPVGYGGVTFRGSVDAGFTPAEIDASFAPSIATAPPLPDGCAF
ncbi:MAG: hypothetical protein AAF928_16505 [Myxococcota bacterium]